MVLQRAWFERNGSAGYVLKPTALRELKANDHPSLDLIQPQRYFSEMSSRHAELSQATLVDTFDTSRKPCLVLKIDVKFAYGCHIPEPSQVRQYYPINKETKLMRSMLEETHLNGAASTDTNDHCSWLRRLKPRQREKEKASFDAEDTHHNLGKLRVQMETRGVDPDQKKVSTRASLNLRGFSAWEETFQFPFLTRNTAECAQLYVEILHDTAGVIANQAFPLTMLRRGNGELRLVDPFRLCHPQTTACLVCNLEMESAYLTQEDFIKLKRLQSTGDQISNASFGL